MTARRAITVLAALAIAPAIARAEDQAPDDDPDVVPDKRARSQASEANLEPQRQREGLAIGISVGPSMQVGFDIEEASAVGGSVDLRIGTSASDRFAWFVDFLITGQPREGDSSTVKLNDNNSLLLGGQLFVLHALHMRAAAGVASLNLRSEESMEMRTKGGFTVLGGGGLDLLRRGRFALSGDVTFTFSVYKGGAVGAFATQLGLTWY